MAENFTGKIRSVIASYFEWEINYECVSGKDVGDVLQSPVFTTSSMGDSSKWQLSLYPNGNCEKNKDYFSLYLTFLRDVEFKVINASLSIVTEKHKKVEKSFECVINNSNNVSNSWGYERFVKRNYIEKSLNDTSHGSTIKIGFKIVIQENGKKDAIKQTNLEEFQRLSTDFEQLIDDEEFNNVEFMIEGKKLRANRSILGKRSRTFAAMFDNEISEKREKEVEITDVRYEIFQKMLHYIYTGKVKGIEKMAGELLAAADKYSLDGLKLMCEKSLCCNVNTDNVFDNLRLADQYGFESLKAKTIKFIVTQAVGIVDKPEFRQLPSNIVCDICSALAQKIK